MNIIFTSGNILTSKSEALVNPVNCEGVMGKGLALQFKKMYPKNNLDYIKACKEGRLYIGKLHYFNENGKIIINFPTKDKWRDNSKLEYIDKGLNDLINIIEYLDIKSISIPALGCGLGKLDWNDVKRLIINKFTNINRDIDVIIFKI